VTAALREARAPLASCATPEHNMKNPFSKATWKLLMSEHGLSALEYVLIAALVALGALAAVRAAGRGSDKRFDKAGTTLNAAP